MQSLQFLNIEFLKNYDMKKLLEALFQEFIRAFLY